MRMMKKKMLKVIIYFLWCIQVFFFPLYLLNKIPIPDQIVKLIHTAIINIGYLIITSDHVIIFFRLQLLWFILHIVLFSKLIVRRLDTLP